MTTLMDKVAETDPDTYQFLVDTAPAIRTSPFSDEIVQEMDSIIKKAGMLGSLGTQFGLEVGGGIAKALAGDMYEAAKRGLTKSRHYRNMLDKNPDLKKMPKTQVMDAFNVLHQFNPDFASNPTVAGAFVRKNSQFPEFDVKQLGDLVGSRKSIQDTKRLPDFKVNMKDMPNKVEDEKSNLQLRKMQRDDTAATASSTNAGAVPPGHQGPSARQKLMLKRLGR